MTVLEKNSTGTIHTTGEKIPSEILKGLCFNCENRKTCSWKEERKLFCEHFE